MIARLTLLGLLAATTTASGVVFDSKVINIDLTRSEATNLCEWFPGERYAITDGGLGWEATPTGQRINGGEIVVHPIAVGFFWRPARSVSIRAEILPGPEELKTTVDPGTRSGILRAQPTVHRICSVSVRRRVRCGISFQEH
jgi:hypothetical protein